MGKKVFKVDLSVKGIEKLKQDLINYRDDLPIKLTRFVKELAEIGIPVIETHMAEANYTYEENGVRSGADTSHYTHVKLNSFGTYAQATLIVEGRELLFIEFGAGVSNNEDAGVGGSPHPKGEEFGFTIGSYGKGYGARKVWGYYAEGGELVLTRGVKATMPVYEADKEIIKSVTKVARKVFG